MYPAQGHKHAGSGPSGARTHNIDGLGIMSLSMTILVPL